MILIYRQIYVLSEYLKKTWKITKNLKRTGDKQKDNVENNK